MGVEIKGKLKKSAKKKIILVLLVVHFSFAFSEIDLEYHNNLINDKVIASNKEQIYIFNAKMMKINRDRYYDFVNDFFPEYIKYYKYYKQLEQDLNYYASKMQEALFIPDDLEVNLDFDRELNIEYYISYQIRIYVNYDTIIEGWRK